MLTEKEGAAGISVSETVGLSKLVNAIESFNSGDIVDDRDKLLRYLSTDVTVRELVSDRKAQIKLCEKLRKATELERLTQLTWRGNNNPLLYIDFPETAVMIQEQAETFMLSGDSEHLYFFPNGLTAVRTRLERAAISEQKVEHLRLQTGFWQEWKRTKSGVRAYEYSITNKRLPFTSSGTSAK
jgi:hypothetical protein